MRIKFKIKLIKIIKQIKLIKIFNKYNKANKLVNNNNKLKIRSKTKRRKIKRYVVLSFDLYNIFCPHVNNSNILCRRSIFIHKIILIKLNIILQHKALKLFQ